MTGEKWVKHTFEVNGEAIEASPSFTSGTSPSCSCDSKPRFCSWGLFLGIFFLFFFDPPHDDPRSATPTCAYSFQQRDIEVHLLRFSVNTRIKSKKYYTSRQATYSERDPFSERTCFKAPTSLVPSPHIRVTYRRELCSSFFCGFDFSTPVNWHVSM